MPDRSASGGRGRGSDVSRAGVKKLYSIAGGRWWDPFRAVWELLTCRDAERDLNALLRRHLTAESRILDLGCGTGANLRRLLRLRLKFASYTGIDFSSDMLSIARGNLGHLPGVTFREADVTELADTAERYDVIIATWLLDHLRKPAAFVNSTARLLADGGHLLLLFYSEPDWVLDFWLSPLGHLTVRADPVRRREVERFADVISKKTYSAGLATLVCIQRDEKGATS